MPGDSNPDMISLMSGLQIMCRWPAVIALAIASYGCSQQLKFETIPEPEVKQTQKTAAESWAAHRLTSWAKDEYPLPGDDLSEAMKPGESEARQKESDKKLEPITGDFKSMTYFETVKSDPPRFVIYRFKGNFTKEDLVEVRMVYNLDGKIDGFWIKPWLNSIH